MWGHLNTGYLPVFISFVALTLILLSALPIRFIISFHTCSLTPTFSHAFLNAAIVVFNVSFLPNRIPADIPIISPTMIAIISFSTFVPPLFKFRCFLILYKLMYIFLLFLIPQNRVLGLILINRVYCPVKMRVL